MAAAGPTRPGPPRGKPPGGAQRCSVGRANRGQCPCAAPCGPGPAGEVPPRPLGGALGPGAASVRERPSVGGEWKLKGAEEDGVTREDRVTGPVPRRPPHASPRGRHRGAAGRGPWVSLGPRAHRSPRPPGEPRPGSPPSCSFPEGGRWLCRKRGGRGGSKAGWRPGLGVVTGPRREWEAGGPCSVTVPSPTGVSALGLSAPQPRG